MALVMLLDRAGYKPRLIQTRAKVTLDQVDDGFKITVIELHTTAEMSGMDASSFKQQAQRPKRAARYPGLWPVPGSS